MKKSVGKLKKIKKTRKRWKKRSVIIIVLLIIISSILSLLWKRNNIAKYLLENTISNLAKADISMSKIDINKKGIFFEDLKVESQTDLYYYLNTTKLDLNLNYSSIFSRSKWMSEIVDSLYIDSPTIEYIQKFKDEESPKRTKPEVKKDSKDDSSFDVRDYVRKVNITNASLRAEVVYKEYFGIRDNFSHANITFDNNRQATFQAIMLDNRQNKFNVELAFSEIGLKSISLDTGGYNPDSLFVPVAEEIKLNLVGKAKLDFASPQGLYLALDLESDRAQANLFDLKLAVENLVIKGDSNNLFVKPAKTTFMNIPISLHGNLISLFKNLEIEAQAEVSDYQIGNTYTFMEGIVNADVDVSGYASNLAIKGKVNSDSLDFNSLVLTNIDASLLYQDQLELQLLHTELDENLISGHGFLHKNFITADLLIKNKEESNITLQGNLLTKGIIIDGNSHFRLLVSDFTLGYGDFLLPPISGLVSLDKDILSGELRNQNLTMNIDTNLAFTSSRAEFKFIDFQANKAYTTLKEKDFSWLNPLVNGNIIVHKNNQKIEANLNLDITAANDNIYLPLHTNVQWDIDTNQLAISNNTIQGKVYNQETNITSNIAFNNFDELNADIIINQNIILKARDLLNDKRGLRLELNQLSLRELKKFFPSELVEDYPNGFVTLKLDYFWFSELIKLDVNMTGIDVAGFSGYGLKASLEGIPEKISIKQLLVYNERQILVSATGAIEAEDGFQANIDALINEIDFKDYQHIIPLEGFVSGDLTFRYDSKEEDKYRFRLKGVGSDFLIDDFVINDVYFNMLYLPQRIHVDNLYLNSHNYADVNVIGDFSYDLFRNEFIPSEERLFVKADADVYNILQKIAPDLLDSGKFNLTSELIVGVDEEGFQVYEGYIKTEDSNLQLLGQPETIENIDITAEVRDNKLELDRFNLKLGDGFLTIANKISEDNDNFFIGNLILGQFRLYTSQQGILAHIPQYMPKNESALIRISGLSNDFATIKGPFDDMKIDLEVNVSNASIIYPPNTENLLSIITSASQNTFGRKDKFPEKEETASNPLPFILDARLVVGENTKYVTYPTDISVTPSSFLNLSYKNNEWSVPSARFVAEEGTVTFLDTDFEVDLVEVLINEIDFSINGTFVKRVQDGSTVTLKVSNGQSNQLGIDDLVLTLASDNPDDKTQAQAINRLRISDNSYDVEQEDQNALQNETILMLGSNVDNTFVNSFLRPVETFFRRRLMLDYFYIRPGFVKNMVNNYVINEPTNDINQDQSRELSDSELAQFSSSILLNNLTISFGRPIYKRLYFDYEGFFQEITDLNRRSKIIYDQDFQIRTNINFQTKMSYTYKYRPSGDSSHEIMLFHSINF